MIKILCSILFLACGTALVTYPAFAQRQTLVLKPSSKWEISYDVDSCRLMRDFGGNDESITIIFSRFGPGDHFRLTLGGNPLKVSSVKRNATLKFGPSEPKQDVRFSVGKMGEKVPAIIFFPSFRIAPETEEEAKIREAAEPSYGYRPPPISADRKVAVTHLSVNGPLQNSIRLELGSMGKPFAALSKCIDELMTHWGIDVEKNKNLTREARPKRPRRFNRFFRYPIDMLRQGQPALVEFRLSIDETGKTTACHIQQTTRPKEFDDAVCRNLLKRGHFFPALDGQGNPIASYFRGTVRFDIQR